MIILENQLIRGASEDHMAEAGRLVAGMPESPSSLWGVHSGTASGIWRRVQLAVKRALDLGVSIPACILLSPIFAAVALAIKLDSPGPVFFVQTRRGINFRPFRIVKFRSLRHGAPDPHERYEMAHGDARITRVGRWLRAMSIDELPQLFNVIEGSMSLVGPRPLIEWESRQALERFAERFAVKPGITGWCQVTVRNSLGFDGRCERDVEYASRFSLAFDLVILAHTPLSLLRVDTIYPKG
jgi:lipopolysaccharide/colanic/teichoic acid biosynthesis glycosyltransferase